MDETIIRTVVAALRDTAAKCDERRVVETPMLRASPFHTGLEPIEPRRDEVEAYSRDWISGRLLGMADMIEATIPPTRDAGP